MIKLNKKGFTLIELLVVIAIIGILASIVLVSLNSARQKGYDTQVKSDVSQLRNAMEICYDNNNGSYANCETAAALGSASMKPPACSGDALITGYIGSTIGVSASAYAIHADLCGGTFDWCADSTGVSKNTTAAVADNATVCP